MAKRYALIAAVMAAVIVYGSLYPFAFRAPAGGPGALAALLQTWHASPGRGDFLANIALYVPLGFFVALALSGLASPACLLATTACGLALCTGVELVQHYDPGRVSSMTDVYSNTLGTFLGAAAGTALGGAFRWPFLREARAAPVPALLLAAWLGFRLYPYVPTIDLHKYWHAVRPLVLAPSLHPYDLFRYTIMWIAIGALVEAFVGRRWWWLAFPFFAGCALGARIVIINTALSLPEVVGGLLAYIAWLALLAGRERARIAVAGVLLLVLIVVMRLQPFHFSAYPGAFGWIPFYSFLHGSLGVNVQSFLEKFFYYGAAVWLLAESGFRLAGATVLVAFLLLVTSAAEIFLPGRSAEITDAAMAVMTGIVFALVKPKRSEGAVARPARPSVHR